jgi:DNA-binding IscR family transcriptional regulator
VPARQSPIVPVEPVESPAWTFLTNHAHVLLCVAGEPDTRVRDLAVRVGITERAVLRILAELEDEGYVVRTRVGRRSSYAVNEALPLRHTIEAHRSVGDLIQLARAPRTKTAATPKPKVHKRRSHEASAVVTRRLA